MLIGKPNPCKWCGGTNHTSLFCYRNKRLLPKSYKKVKAQGKHASKWKKKRAEWIANNPPNHQGYYTCYICGRAVHQSVLTLDHIQSRSHRPDLRYDDENLMPCCWSCNHKKGSKSFDL